MPKVETFNKSLVIAQATKVFHEKGYNATSMQDLVDATGLNRSSIYNTFKNKINLFLDCLKSYQDEHQRATSRLLLTSNSAIEAINAIFESYLQTIVNSKKDLGCLITNCKSEMAFHEPNITQFLSNNQDSSLQLFEDLIEKGQQEGDINTKQSKTSYALYLYTCLQGFRMTGILLNDKSKLQSIVDTTLQTII